MTLKFRVKNKISKVSINGKVYKPGDIVDLPEKYLRKDWLELVQKPKVDQVEMPKPVFETKDTKEPDYVYVEKPKENKIKRKKF